MTEQCSSHQWAIATLVYVGTVIDHPLCDRESCRTRRLPWHAAFGNPGQRAVLVVAKRSAVQGRVTSHESLDALEIVGVDGVLEVAELLERLDVGFELWPTGKSIE